MPPTLLLPPRYTTDTNAVSTAAARAKWHTLRLPSWRVPEHLRTSPANFVLYGEPLFARIIAGQLDLSLIEPPLSFLPSLPEPYVRRPNQLLTLADARALRAPFFIKPADDKSFPARVYNGGTDLPSADILPATTPVLIAEPVEWDLEYRAFVLDRKVAAMSVYLRHRDLSLKDGAWWSTDEEDRAAADFLQSVLADPAAPVPPAVVIDIGIIRHRGWAVVEANPCWGSGIYGCNPDALLPVLRRATVPDADLTDEDRRWVNPEKVEIIDQQDERSRPVS